MVVPPPHLGNLVLNPSDMPKLLWNNFLYQTNGPAHSQTHAHTGSQVRMYIRVYVFTKNHFATSLI